MPTKTTLLRKKVAHKFATKFLEGDDYPLTADIHTLVSQLIEDALIEYERVFAEYLLRG